MKRSAKQLSSKTKVSTFSRLNLFNLKLKLCEKSHSHKNCQKIKLEGEWGELEAKNCFQRQSWKKYMRQTLVFSAIQESFISIFEQFSTSIKKTLGLEGRLCTRL